MNNTKILTASLNQIPTLTPQNNLTTNNTAVSQRIDNGRYTTFPTCRYLD